MKGKETHSYSPAKNTESISIIRVLRPTAIKLFSMGLNCFLDI